MANAATSISGYAPVQGGELYYETAGAGRAVVLIHAGVADCSMWDEQFTELARQLRVIRYDVRGYGRSRSEAVIFSYQRDLVDLLDFLGLEKAALVGVSRGGMIAIDTTIEHPQRVEALITVASGIGGFQHQPDGSPKSQTEVEMFARMEELWEKRELEALNKLEVRMWVDGPGQPEGRADPSVRQWVLHMNYQDLTHPDEKTTVQELEPPAAGRLGEIRVPTLVIAGDLDTTRVLASAEALAQGIPGARKVIIPGTAHMLSMEQPGEFNRVVLEFLGNQNLSANFANIR
jgi:pimeloyl-ACP methyl ester carboxylesterase